MSKNYHVTIYGIIEKGSRHSFQWCILISFYVGRQEAQSNTAQEKDSKKVTADIESLGEKGVNRRGGSTDPNFLTLAVPRLSVCADAQKVDRAKLAQTEVTNLNRNPTYGNQYKIFVLSRTCIIVRYV